MSGERLGELTRRAALRWLGCGLLGAALWPGESWGGASKVKEVSRGRRGTTLTLSLEEAPFPFRGKPWKDDTVLVYVPHHHRVGANRRREVHLVMHFHGHGTTAKEAVELHQLREQLVESRQNAILVVPQLAVRASTGHPGKLGEPGGLLRLLTELRQVLQSQEVSRALGKAALHPSSRVGRLCLSSHSGGYRAALACLKEGQFDVRELYLFDSLYDGAAEVAAWVKAGKPDKKQWTHKLICYYAGGAVKRESLAVKRLLEQSGVEVLHEEREGTLTRKQLTSGRAVLVKTTNSHRGVTHQHNELRDCLYASTLPRRDELKTSWFDRKNQPRELEERVE